MWWPGPALTSNFWYEAHNSPGVDDDRDALGRRGRRRSAGATDARTYVLIANPAATARTRHG